MVIHIKPGEYYLGPYVDEEIITVLGSCISVIMWHPSIQYCAMSHFVVLNTNNNEDDDIGRYGERVLPYLVRHFDLLKCSRQEIRVSVYGGAVSNQASTLNSAYQVGRKNSEYAINFLKEQGFNIDFTDIGGTRGRKLMYSPMNNQCKAQLLPSLTE